MFRRPRSFEWYRIGNFDSNSIYFVNPHPNAAIRAITFSRASDGTWWLQLRTSGLATTGIVSACTLFFNANEYKTFGAHQGIIDIDSDITSLSKLLQLFDYLNKDTKDESQEFTPNLIAEIKQLFYKINGKSLGSIKYYLSEKHIVPAYINPSLTNSTNLIKIVKNSKKELIPDEVRLGLARGENPNQMDKHGLTLLFFVISYADIDTLKLILYYGGNPFIPNDNVTFVSAADFAFFHKMSDVLDVIQQQFTPLNKLKITNIEFSKEKDELDSLVTFSNDTIIATKLVLADKLTKEHHTQMFRIYDKSFESSDPEQKIETLFAKDLVGPNKFIRLLYSDKAFIGFLIYEWVKLKENTEHRIIHCVCSAINPRYSGNGLMALLSFDLAIALQLMTDLKKMGSYFGAIHVNSNRVVKELLYFPKYRAVLTDNVVHELLSILYQRIITFTQGRTDCQIDEPLKVRGSYTKRPNDISEWHFNKFQLNVLELKENQSKLVPTFFYIGSEVSNQLMDATGFDLHKYFEELAQKLQTVLYKEVSEFLGSPLEKFKPAKSLGPTLNDFYGPKMTLRSRG